VLGAFHYKHTVAEKSGIAVHHTRKVLSVQQTDSRSPSYRRSKQVYKSRLYKMFNLQFNM